MVISAALIAILSASRGQPVEPWPTVQIKRNFTKEVNRELLAAPAEQRAWPKYRALNAALERVPPELDVITDVDGPDHPKWHVLTEYIQEQKGIIAQLHAIAAMPVFGAALSDPEDARLLGGPACPTIDLDSNPPFIDHTSYYVGTLRMVTRHLVGDMRVAMHQGDTSRAVADVEAMVGVSRHAASFPDVVHTLLSSSILRIAVSSIGDLLAHDGPSLSGEQLRKLATLLQSCRDEAFRIRYEGDRLIVLDVLQRLYSDDGNGDGRMTLDGARVYFTEQLWSDTPRPSPFVNASDRFPDLRARLFMFFSLVLNFASRREELAAFDEACRLDSAARCSPMWEWKRVPWNAGTDFLKPPGSPNRYPIASVLFAGGSHTFHGPQHAIQRRDALLAVIAAHQFRADTGRWPDALDDLVPKYLAAIPVDRFTGTALRYRVAEPLPIFYSVGADRDDDAGRPSDPPEQAFAWRPAPDAQAPDAEPAADGDWVLWPP